MAEEFIQHKKDITIISYNGLHLLSESKTIKFLDCFDCGNAYQIQAAESFGIDDLKHPECCVDVGNQNLETQICCGKLEHL